MRAEKYFGYGKYWEERKIYESRENRLEKEENLIVGFIILEQEKCSGILEIFKSREIFGI